MKNKTILTFVLLGLIVVVFATITVFAIKDKQNTVDNPKTEETKKETTQTTDSSEIETDSSEIETDSSEIEDDNDSYDKKIDEEPFTKEGAVDATTKMLKELKKSPKENETLESRMKLTSQKDYNVDDVFTKEGWDDIYFADFLKTDPRGETLTAQALLSIIHTIEETGNVELTPTEMKFDGVVYFDSTLKTAYVPIDLYTNAPTNLSFEMVYVDGKWMLQPYSLIAQIAIRTMSTEQATSTLEEKAANDSKNSINETTSSETTETDNDN